LGEYIKSYASYVWYVRFMILPYAFLGILLAIVLFYLVPKIRFIRVLDKIQLTWGFFLGVLLVVQGLWIPIWNKYSSTEPDWQRSVVWAGEIAAHYQGGGLLITEGEPDIIYALVRYHQLEGRNIVSQMFDPYYYFGEDVDPYLDWDQRRETVLGWLKENNIRTIVTYPGRERYYKLAEAEPQFVSEPTPLSDTPFTIYQVKDELYQREI
jgi:hypothetical protein